MVLCRVVNRKGEWFHAVANTDRKARELAVAHGHLKALTEGSVSVVTEEGRTWATGLDELLSGSIESRVIRLAAVGEDGKTEGYRWNLLRVFGKGSI